MCTSSRLTEVRNKALRVEFDRGDKFVFFSDCHRGVGKSYDDFAHNKNLFLHALDYYNALEFTCVLVGDTVELWENKRFQDILVAYSDVEEKLAEFHDSNRLYIVYGNHDIEWKKGGEVSAVIDPWIMPFNAGEGWPKDLTTLGVKVHEGLLLIHKDYGDRLKLLVVHGHQGELLGDTCWRLGRFFVRYFWRRLQFAGFADPTSPAKNHRKANSVEKKILDWIADENHGNPIIFGHSHRPHFPDRNLHGPGTKVPYYFNTGSCVHPYSITGIEIVDGQIMQVKWHLRPSRYDERVPEVATLKGFRDAAWSGLRKDMQGEDVTKAEHATTQGPLLVDVVRMGACELASLFPSLTE